MFSRFFVRRPVFAWVIAILIMLAGILAIRTLPVAQYPDVAPPTIKISATYTGASAETLENSVTQVIEQQLTGLDNLLYFSSTSSSDGSVSINVTFEQGTDPDTAQVQVQNKIQQAESRLPSEVQQTGVTVEKSQSNFLLIAAVYDTTDKASSSDIADWLVIRRSCCRRNLALVQCNLAWCLALTAPDLSLLHGSSRAWRDGLTR